MTEARWQLQFGVSPCSCTWWYPQWSRNQLYGHPARNCVFRRRHDFCTSGSSWRYCFLKTFNSSTLCFVFSWKSERWPTFVMSVTWWSITKIKPRSEVTTRIFRTLCILNKLTVMLKRIQRLRGWKEISSWWGKLWESITQWGGGTGRIRDFDRLDSEEGSRRIWCVLEMRTCCGMVLEMLKMEKKSSESDL